MRRRSARDKVTGGGTKAEWSPWTRECKWRLVAGDAKYDRATTACSRRTVHESRRTQPTAVEQDEEMGRGGLERDYQRGWTSDVPASGHKSKRVANQNAHSKWRTWFLDELAD